MATPKDAGKLKATIARRDKTIASLRKMMKEEARRWQSLLDTIKQKHKAEQKEWQRIKVTLINFLCDGPEFEDKVSDIVRERLDSYHRPSDAW